MSLKKGALKKKASKGLTPSGPSKVLLKTEDDYEPVNRWWERDDGAESGKRGAKKWDTLEHHGLVFAPDYEQHNIPLVYDGKEVKLGPEADELAYYWTSVRGTPYETKDVFIKNFWSEFTKVLPPDTIIKDFKKCDFSRIWQHREDARLARNNRTKEEKEAATKATNDEAAYYTHAILNGIRERLGAIKLEPPQLFRGRGEHPKQGLLKRRTLPEQICLNLGPDAFVPKPAGNPGHAWQDVMHENTVQWIASYEDTVLGIGKVVSFGANSGIKGQPDLLKYDRARRLVSHVGKIRESYEKLQTSNVAVDRQKATATYFIDRLALRVGGEKNEEEEADTVGCCSLRCEHLKLELPNKVHFDFLGKDSIRYKNTVEVTAQVYTNLESFMRNKKGEEDVFDKVQPGILNEYFKDFMDDLSAKVFRTYNASFTLQKQLNMFDFANKDKFGQDDLVKFYNDANREVAILCNHQKAESKTHGEAMAKMADMKETMEKNIKILQKHLAFLKDPSKGPVKVKKDMVAKLPKDDAGCKKRIAETKLRLDKHEKAMAMKDDNKCVSLGTSKMNYMDPRITVAWCKKVDLQIETVFPRTVRTKFPWAMHFKSEYEFE